MCAMRELNGIPYVALRKESVDRNSVHEVFANFEGVALRKESVDRNLMSVVFLLLAVVALRKESVDRNLSIFRQARAF